MDWGDREQPIEDWKEEKSRRMAEQMAKNVGPGFKEPDLVAMALAKINPELPARLIEEWASEAQEAVVTALGTYAEETGRPDLAEALENVVAEITCPYRQAGVGASEAEEL
jgi:hypothetical protein